jgi:hypothetical protein
VAPAQEKQLAALVREQPQAVAPALQPAVAGWFAQPRREAVYNTLS